MQNIQADPRVTIRVGGWTGEGRARVVDPGAEPALAAEVSARFDAKHGWSDGLIVELGPLGDASADATGTAV